MERAAAEKQKQIEFVKDQNNRIEEQKKQEFLRAQAEAEERKRQQDAEAEAERRRRIEEEQEKQNYRENVRKTMIKVEERRKKSIIDKRQQQDQKLMTAQQIKEQELRYKKELEYLKRRDRQETVERIQRIQQYERDKVMEKIQNDDTRTLQVKAERNNLLAARREMRSQADKQKEEMMKAFERMQLKGKIDVRPDLFLTFVAERAWETRSRS